MIPSFFSFKGRVPRSTFWWRIFLLGAGFTVLFLLLSSFTGRSNTWILYPFFFWSFSSLLSRRYHDLDKSGAWGFLLFIPILGPLWVGFELFLRKSRPEPNRYDGKGGDPGIDYFTVKRTLPAPGEAEIINDVTALNPIPVAGVSTPTTVEELQEAIRNSQGPLSIGGGHFSMGGQTASPGSLHLDLRGLNRIVDFSAVNRTIRVQAGTRWCDIQRFVDPHGLSVKIMQTYANFTVGGALSVNAHGRYMGLGPLILSVRALSLVLADGSRVEASPSQNAELFYGAIGGYSGLAVIAEAEFDLAENKRVERLSQKLPIENYGKYFKENIRDSKQALFHNADIYPPHYTRVRSVTWVETEKPATRATSLQIPKRSYPLERYFLWAFSETPLGKWRREFLIEPLLYLRAPVHWRNYEAGYDVRELEPASREKSTYVLQEYFVPVGKFDEFVPKMREILERYQVNMLNISVRHALPDPGSLLAWARQESFAFVLYYKQGVTDEDKNHVALWTRELIEAVLSVEGAYYLPYQPHATEEQFHRAYPKAREFFALKRKYDPKFRLRNSLWDKYYAPTLAPSPAKTVPAGSDFHTVYSNPRAQDRFYLFLQNIYHLYPEDKLHLLIREACAKYTSDEDIYRHLQKGFPGIKPFLSELFYALPALGKQKKEMIRQILKLLGDKRSFNGYVEIGSPGRYISELKKHARFEGPMILVNETAPSFSPPDLMERGGLRKIGRFVPLGDYTPFHPGDMADNSMDLVTCLIGLHHSPLDRLDAFVKSIRRTLRPGGIFILRDHDAKTSEMKAFVSLAHAVYNAGLGISWEENQKELRYFESTEHWNHYLEERGFKLMGPRLFQANDPTDNALMAFSKVR